MSWRSLCPLSTEGTSELCPKPFPAHLSALQHEVTQNTVPCPIQSPTSREGEKSSGEELHFEIVYVPRIFPPTPHLCEHVCPMDNLLIPASSQGWDDPDNGCPTVAHTPQLWPRGTTFGTSTTPGVELFPGSASPRAPLSIQLVETTRHPEVRPKCPTFPECCHVLLKLRPAGTAFRRSVKHK